MPTITSSRENNPMRVETGRGVLSLALNVDNEKVQQVTVNMGEPILNLPEIPVNPEAVTRASDKNTYRLHLIQGNDVIEATFVFGWQPPRDPFTWTMWPKLI